MLGAATPGHHWCTLIIAYAYQPWRPAELERTSFSLTSSIVTSRCLASAPRASVAAAFAVAAAATIAAVVAVAVVVVAVVAVVAWCQESLPTGSIHVGTWLELV